MLDIKVTRRSEGMQRPDYNDLGFGNYFTDHMFVMVYTEGQGWHDPEIKPYEDLRLPPAACVFHYGQEMFEGLKAYKRADGGINLFRPEMNARRTNRTNDRICLPELDEKDFVQAVKALVDIDRDWVPVESGQSLYIRPFIIATEETLMVHPSRTYMFMIILSPVGAYYAAGIKPVKIYVEDELVRAVKGGTGEAKTGGNYGASLAGQQKAKELGYAQVLWLDAIEHRYVEEVGTSNIFFVLEDTIVTPPLTGSILPGITRDSVIEMLRSWGYKVEERQIAIEEVAAAADNGSLKEVFGSGTAAVISPVGSLYYKKKDIVVNDMNIGGLTSKIYDTLTGIQQGSVEDTFGWITEV